MSELSEELRWIDATATAGLVRAGEVKGAEVVDAAIERIEAGDGALHAVIHRSFERAAPRSRPRHAPDRRSGG